MFDEDGITEKQEQPKREPSEIIEDIAFSNAHTVGYALYHKDKTAATALMRELQYWVEGKDYVRQSYKGE